LSYANHFIAIALSILMRNTDKQHAQ